MGSVLPPARHQQQQQPQLVDRPIFHVAARFGWVNDPNAPLYWKGRYHLFYQHISSSTSWTWGLCWGHVSSTDLIHWQHHPPALTPTPGAHDEDGCFSGCATVLPASAITSDPTKTTAGEGDAQPTTDLQQCLQLDWLQGAVTRDVPVLLYTGVVRRPDAPEGLRTSSLTVSELCVERQMAAVPTDLDDPYLTHWTKVPLPWLSSPPQRLCLNCFRDPFVLEQPSADNDHTWRVMLGAGVREPGTGLTCAGDTAAAAAEDTAGEAAAAAAADCNRSVGVSSSSSTGGDLRRAAKGTALVYKSKNLLSGWEFEGHLCTAREPATDGVVWECPLIAKLPMLDGQTDYSKANIDAAVKQPADDVRSTNPNPLDRSHLFSVSAGRCPALYWLGSYSNGKFNMKAAAGPYPLDLGDIMYAPNVLANSQVGVILWGWLFELPNPGGSHDYAGCISLPRLLHLTPDGHLHQQPLPQINLLHSGQQYTVGNLNLTPGTVKHIGSNIPTSYFDLQLTLIPQQAMPPAAAAADLSTPGDPSCLAGIVLPFWSTSSTDASSTEAAAVSGQGVVLMYDFISSRLTAVIGDDVGQDLITHHTLPPEVLERYHELAATGKFSNQQQQHKQQSRAGIQGNIRVLSGQLRLASYEPVMFRVLMDYSLLEVFTSDGQVLSTRVYRGVWPHSNNLKGSPHPVLGQQTLGAATTQPAVAAEDGVSLSHGGVSDSNVPCGAYTFAISGTVAARDISMSAMSSAWIDDWIDDRN